VVEVCKSHVVPGEVWLLGEDTLITFQSDIQLAEESLDAGFVGGAMALALFEDLG
jgi:hypothetical protein